MDSWNENLFFENISDTSWSGNLPTGMEENNPHPLDDATAPGQSSSSAAINLKKNHHKFRHAKEMEESHGGYIEAEIIFPENFQNAIFQCNL